MAVPRVRRARYSGGLVGQRLHVGREVPKAVSFARCHTRHFTNGPRFRKRQATASVTSIAITAGAACKSRIVFFAVKPP